MYTTDVFVVYVYTEIQKYIFEIHKIILTFYPTLPFWSMSVLGN